MSLDHNELTHRGWVVHRGNSKPGHHWFRLWLFACPAPNHYLSQWWRLPLGRNMSETLIEMQIFSFKKMHSKSRLRNSDHLPWPQCVTENFSASVQLPQLTSLMKLLAIFRSTSGAILGTLSEYSPMSQRMLARAMGTVMVSANLARWMMMSLCSLGCGEKTLWYHNMKTFCALLALCEGNPPVTCDFPSQRASNAELWRLLCCWPEQNVEQKVKWPTDLRYFNADVTSLWWIHEILW